MKICLECEGISDTPLEHCASCGGPLSPTEAVHFPLRRGEADAANPLIGTTVDGKYLVQGVLGKGGMGTVFRAIHRVSLVPVALKILNPRFSVQGEYRDYFLAEAQKAGRVTHEHAGRVLDVGEAANGMVYIAMEEVSGVTLHECIHGLAPLAPTIVVDILEQVCQALVAAHGSGLVHRDLTPRNVMVVARGDGEPFVKILDFGIAKGLPHVIARETSDPELQLAPAGFANPPYSAPEHLEGKDVDARADLYSLGVIAYEALVQRTPVQGANRREIAGKTLRGELEPLMPPPGVPMRLVKLIQSLLARDPDDRPSSAADVLMVLNSISQPQSRLVRDLAVMVLLISLVVVSLAFTLPDEPTLALRMSASDFRLQDATESEPIYLQSEDLEQLSFDFDGFAAGEFVADLSSASGREPFELDAVEGESGTLDLDRSTGGGYDALVSRLTERCAEEGGAVTVTFQPLGGSALGSAMVVVDDAPPVVTIEFSDEGVLKGDSSLVALSDEDFGLESFELEFRVGDEDPEWVPLDAVQERTLSGLFGELHSGVQKASVSFKVTALDRAGNAAEPFEVTRELDLRVSRPENAAEVVQGYLNEDGATLSLALDEMEPGLTVSVHALDADGNRGPDCSAEQRPPRSNLLVVDIALGEEPDPSDFFYFVLEDPAGNTWDFSSQVEFRERDFRLALVDNPALHGTLLNLNNTLLWTGAAVSFEIICNDIYTPANVSTSGDATMTQLGEIVDQELGKATVEFRAVSFDGEFSLYVGLDPDDRFPYLGPDNAGPLPLWVLHELPRLELPDTSGVRFYVDLIGPEGLFAVAEDKLVPAGWALRSDPVGKPWIVQGDVYWGADATEPDKETLGEGPRVELYPGRRIRLLRENNVLYLDLQDVFGREVEVLLGRDVAPTIDLDGTRVAKVVEFQYQPDVARFPSVPLQLEFDQPTELTVRSDYRFDPSDLGSITLQFDRSPQDCVGLEIDPGGTDLQFEIPFDDVVEATLLDRDDPRLKTSGEKFLVDVVLSTPAGDLREQVEVVSTRSSLREATIAEAFTEEVPDRIGEIQMVPVLSPLKDFEDRVSEDQRVSGGFLRHRPIRVRSIADCYLQEREMTRAQYVAIVQAYLALPAAGKREASTVFPGDPREDRLSPDGMVPQAETVAKWLEEVRVQGSEPVTGLDFYQAYAVARMAGVVLAGDPALFRLPFGVELELAALGAAEPGVLNGSSGRYTVQELRDGAEGVVATELGDIFGLDFSAREWVMDLPWPVGESRQEEQTLVSFWLADHSQHMARAAGGFETEAIGESLRNYLRRIGVVRGVKVKPSDRPETVWGLRVGLQDPLPADVPGVVQTMYIRRDGAGHLPGEPHASLREVGLRLAGGKEFIAKVRNR